jgi:hypothetical protein
MFRSWDRFLPAFLRPARNRKTRRGLRKQPSVRLGVTDLEARVTPNNTEFTLPRPYGPMVFSSAAVGSQGNGAILYSAQGEDGNYAAYVELTDSHGKLVGDPIQVNTDVGGDAIAANIAMASDGNYVATYWGAGPDGEGLYARRYYADGTSPDVSEFCVTQNIYPGYGNAPTVAIDPDDNFAIAWNDAGNYGAPTAQI